MNYKDREKNLKELIGDKDIKEAIKEGLIGPYIKPLTTKHESGYKNFEVGYCTRDAEHHAVISRQSDHICWMQYLIETCSGPVKKVPSLNMDCDDYGRIRFYRGFMWDSDMSLSTMMLKYIGDFNDQ